MPTLMRDRNMNKPARCSRQQELQRGLNCDNMASARPEATVNRKHALGSRAPFAVCRARSLMPGFSTASGCPKVIGSARSLIAYGQLDYA